LSDEELHDKFNKLWKKWVYDVSSTIPPVTELNSDVDSEDILWEYFQKERNI
jgi:hypothetical protein